MFDPVRFAKRLEQYQEAARRRIAADPVPSWK